MSWAIWQGWDQLSIAYLRVHSLALRIASLSLTFQSSATSFAKGSSGFGALRSACMDSKTVLIWSAGLHLSLRISRQILPNLQTNWDNHIEALQRYWDSRFAFVIFILTDQFFQQKYIWAILIIIYCYKDLHLRLRKICISFLFMRKT